jgi:phosphatidylinositol glycan class K
MTFVHSLLDLMLLRLAPWLLSLVISCLYLPHILADDVQAEARAAKFFDEHGKSESGHTNNWAVLVCASRYWFNYRVRECVLLLPESWQN